MFHDIIVNTLGACAWAFRSLFQAPARLTRSVRLALKGDWWSALDILAGLAAPVAWAWALGPVTAGILGSLSVYKNLREAWGWHRGEGEEAILMALGNRKGSFELSFQKPDMDRLREDLGQWAMSKLLAPGELQAHLCLLIYGLLLGWLLISEGAILASLILAGIVALMYAADFHSFKAGDLGVVGFTGLRDWMGAPRKSYVGNPLVQDFQWAMDIPRRIGLGYAMLRWEASQQDVHPTGPIFGLMFSSFNAFVIYVPKFIRSFVSWVTKGTTKFPRGLVACSPIVAYFLAMGSAWAVAIIGHEFGHLSVYDERAWDWWWWVGMVVPELVGQLAGTWAWVAHAAITLVNEAWASIHSYRRGWAVGCEGVGTLVLAWSTYLSWGIGILHDVMVGLDPAMTGAA